MNKYELPIPYNYNNEFNYYGNWSSENIDEEDYYVSNEN